ncbi:hypothetical protein TEQG_04424 [Trichophyton equinum CBS 127.97]|uniref:Uncharacterized protein n=1 Tax=Trichophyton equinum (strain ATCC MYA-4606 / CBS 127.97) TaxID=559882 RepID=F2PTQ0_TRIEC|nr:hypothetical protein TEQG_04424 [Trichophyton equinum CBS 127.97]
MSLSAGLLASSSSSSSSSSSASTTSTTHVETPPRATLSGFDDAGFFVSLSRLGQPAWTSCLSLLNRSPTGGRGGGSVPFAGARNQGWTRTGRSNESDGRLEVVGWSSWVEEGRGKKKAVWLFFVRKRSAKARGQQERSARRSSSNSTNRTAPTAPRLD